MAFFNRSRNSRSSNAEAELTDLITPAQIVIRAEDDDFIEAIRANDFKRVKSFLDREIVDINCIDRTGRTALQIAVQEKNVHILEELLKRGAEIGNALLDAVKIESLKCVQTIVHYEKERGEGATTHNLDRHRSITSVQDTNLHMKVLTPLILAAQIDNFEITQFLMIQEYTIEKPHPKFCNCVRCEELERLGCYLGNLNKYQAMVSPVHISLMFLLQDPNDTSPKLDPIYRAFVLKKQILHHADSEFEFREDYLKLAEKCEDFAVALLDQCCDLEEISLFMTMPAIKDAFKVEVLGGSPRQKALSVLNFAIKHRNKKFIAHRYSQVMLNSVIYHGLKAIEVNGMALNGILILAYWIIMPILMIMYQLLPTNRFTKWLESPIIKYLSHLGSMVWFLCLLIMAAFQDKLPGSKSLQISPLDILIALCVIGILVEEAKQAIRQGKERYISQWWHLVTIFVVLLFILAGTLWLAGYFMLVKGQDSFSVSLNVLLMETNVTPRSLLLLSHSFYAIALVLAFFQVSYNFQVSYVFGPLHLSLMRMVGDVLKFFVLFVINYFAFCIGLRKLYSQYVATINSAVKTQNLTSTVHYEFEGAVKTQNLTSTVHHEFEGAEGTFSHLFWALFGLTDPKLFDTAAGFEITKVTGNLMFAAYNITAILVALNVLIAMLSNTFQKISEHQDESFKVARTQILMQYVNRGSVVPSPFNLFAFKAAARGILSLCTKCAMPDYDEGAIKYNENRRNHVIRRLIHRYFQGKNERNKSSSSEILEAIEQPDRRRPYSRGHSPRPSPRPSPRHSPATLERQRKSEFV